MKKKNLFKIQCKVCKKIFYVFKYLKDKKYCSRRCYGHALKFSNQYSEARNRMKTINLGRKQSKEAIAKRSKIFKGRKHSQQWCKNISISLKKYHSTHKHFGDKAHNWRGGRHKFNGYIFIYSPYHPYQTKKKYVFEHRLVIEQQIGRYLLPEERVHHLGKKDDNRPHMLMGFINRCTHIRFEKGLHINPSDIIFDGRKLHK